MTNAKDVGSKIKATVFVLCLKVSVAYAVLRRCQSQLCQSMVLFAVSFAQKHAQMRHETKPQALAVMPGCMTVVTMLALATMQRNVGAQYSALVYVPQGSTVAHSFDPQILTTERRPKVLNWSAVVTW